MNVFADLHQDDLYWSLHLLFEKRLGWKLFRPLGVDWWTSGFWKYSEDTRTADQYLRPTGEEIDQFDYSFAYERRHNYNHRVLSFEQFKKFPIDIVIASVVQHEVPYWNLVKEYKPKAKFIRQAGNIHDITDLNICKNIMASVLPFPTPPDINAVFYHQEFDLKTFSFEPAKNLKRITSLMNCLPDSPDYPLYLKFKSLLPEFDFKMYGILGDDGIIGTTKGVAQAFKDTGFVWHTKHQGDGFGHVIHNAFATGRPPIVIKKYYNNTLAGELMIDGQTCITLDDKSTEQAIEAIKHFSEPSEYHLMSQRAYRRFCELVDFNKDFLKIKGFLANLK